MECDNAEIEAIADVMLAHVAEGAMPSFPSDTSPDVLNLLVGVLQAKKFAILPFVRKYVSSVQVDAVPAVLVVSSMIFNDPSQDWTHHQWVTELPQSGRDAAVALFSGYSSSLLPSPGASDQASSPAHHNLSVSWLTDTVRIPVADEALGLALERGAKGFTPSELRKTYQDIPLVVPQSAPSRKGAKHQMADSELYDHAKLLDAACSAIIDGSPTNTEKAVALLQHALFSTRNWRLRGFTQGGAFKPPSAVPLVDADVRDNVKNAAAVLKTLRNRGRGRGPGRGSGRTQFNPRGRGRGYNSHSPGYQHQHQAPSGQTSQAPQSGNPSRYGANYQKPRGPPRQQQ